MSEQNSSHENNDYTFLREKITERPINKRKVFRQSLLTIALAVTFALVACFVFFFFEKGTLNSFNQAPEPEKVELKLLTFALLSNKPAGIGPMRFSQAWKVPSKPVTCVLLSNKPGGMEVTPEALNVYWKDVASALLSNNPAGMEVTPVQP